MYPSIGIGIGITFDGIRTSMPCFAFRLVSDLKNLERDLMSYLRKYLPHSASQSLS
jgi:hypothetical protein